MKENKMAVMPMNKLVMNMSIPLMVSLLVQSLYNIVDSMFVAKLGEDALAAVSLAFPVHLIMIAVGVGTSVGVNALLSKSIGAKKLEETSTIATTGVILAIFSTIVFMLVGLFGSSALAQSFTSQLDIQENTRIYIYICTVFSLGSFLATMYQRFLQAAGNTFGSMLTLVAGAITNIILDPIMIFGLGPVPAMGVAGAAIATIIGQFLSAILAILLNIKKNQVVKVQWDNFTLQKKTVLGIYKVGLPTMVTQALGSVMVTVVNSILIDYSATAVAFFGVYYKLQSFLFMPMNGLGQAAIPIAGYNYGAKNYNRIKEMLRVMLPIAIGISLVMTVVFLAIPQYLLALFNASGAMLEIGVPALRIISISFVFASVTIILGYSMSGLGNGLVNMIGTALRQVVILIPLISYISSHFGLSYIWYAFWAAEIISMVWAIFYSKSVMKRKLQ